MRHLPRLLLLLGSSYRFCIQQLLHKFTDFMNKDLALSAVHHSRLRKLGLPPSSYAAITLKGLEEKMKVLG